MGKNIVQQDIIIDKNIQNKAALIIKSELLKDKITILSNNKAIADTIVSEDSDKASSINSNISKSSSNSEQLKNALSESEKLKRYMSQSIKLRAYVNIIVK